MLGDKKLNLTSGTLLTKNALYNIFSQITPILIGILTIPILIKQLGTEVFGVLTIAWMVIGFFSIFDLGIGRAITVFCSDRLVTKEQSEIPEILWTALSILAVFGILTSITILLTADQIVLRLFNVSKLLREETIEVVMILAVTIPLLICSGCMLNFLASYQKFNLISIVRTVIGSITFIGPLIVLSFTNSLTLICFSLALAKLIEFLIYAYLCTKVNSNIWSARKISKFYIGPLLSYGGWMTVSNIVGALMNYADRFFVAAILTTAAVAYYVTPSDLIVRFMIVPGAIVGVLFPAFCAAYKRDKENIIYLFNRGIKFTIILVFPVIIIVTTLSREFLSLWLGEDFAIHSTLPLQYIAIGGLANSISYIPFAIIQAAGRPDLTGKLHLLEFSVFVIVVYFLIRNFGIEGAAIGWMLRSTIDALILMVLANNLIQNQTFIRKLFYVFSLLVGISSLPLLFDMRLIEKLSFLFISLSSLGLVTYLIVLEDNDRRILKKIILKFIINKNK